MVCEHLDRLRDHGQKGILAAQTGGEFNT